MSGLRSRRRPPSPNPAPPSRHENGTRTAHASGRRRRTHSLPPSRTLCSRRPDRPHTPRTGRGSALPSNPCRTRAAPSGRLGPSSRSPPPSPTGLLGASSTASAPTEHCATVGVANRTCRPGTATTSDLTVLISDSCAGVPSSGSWATLPAAHVALGTTLHWGKRLEQQNRTAVREKSSRRRCPQAFNSSRRATRCSVCIWETDVRKAAAAEQASPSLMSVSHQNHGLVGAAWSSHGSRLGSQLGGSRERLLVGISPGCSLRVLRRTLAMSSSDC